MIPFAFLKEGEVSPFLTLGLAIGVSNWCLRFEDESRSGCTLQPLSSEMVSC